MASLENDFGRDRHQWESPNFTIAIHECQANWKAWDFLTLTLNFYFVDNFIRHSGLHENHTKFALI